MNQKIFKQIRNEWRSNVWLCVELLVVSVILWYIVDCSYVHYTVRAMPLGFNVEHCYLLDLNTVSESSPEFKTGIEYEQMCMDKLEIIERLRRRPEIEAVAASQNSYPYNGSNSGGDFTVDSMKTTGYTVTRFIQPDFFKVFRIEGANGETPEQLAAALDSWNKAVVSENLLQRDFGIDDMRPYIGHDIFYPGDTQGTPHPIAAVAKTMRYNDYNQGQMNRCVFACVGNGDVGWMNELTVRVRPDMDHDFIEKLMADAEDQLRVGNYYLGRVTSFADIRTNAMRASDREATNYFIGMGFLLVNIFLGLLGTFWFRTQQRVPDIAVRMVNGATRADIFRLLVGEGLLLLTVVTPVALAIDANLAHLELNDYLATSDFLSVPRLLLCGGIAYALMALMIVLGISIPAFRAMHIAPANALRAE